MSFSFTDNLLVIPYIKVQNANAISSPLTHGFPSITAFIGLMWAFERKLKQQGIDIPLNAVGVACHDYQELVSGNDFIKTFCLTRNPLDKNGDPSSIVEEGRIHMDISLVFNTSIEDIDEWKAAYLKKALDTLYSMRIAGGTPIPPQNPSWQRYHADVYKLSDFPTICRTLMPGFTLVERHDLLEMRLSELKAENPEATLLDAWLSLSRINWRHYQDGNNEGKWKHDRSGLGWIVPIPVGYSALGDLHPGGAVANARDKNTPFRFVESVYSIGQWISPYRLSTPEQFLWYADSQPENGLYRCRNDYSSISNQTIAC